MCLDLLCLVLFIGLLFLCQYRVRAHGDVQWQGGRLVIVWWHWTDPE